MTVPHHGDLEPMQSELIQRFRDQLSGHYQRQFPHGRMGADDDGDFTYAIATDRKHQTIVIRFAHATEWIGLDLQSALQLRDALNSRIVELQTLAEHCAKK